MSQETIPEWAKNAPRIDRPDITTWYKPESGPLDGVLVWRGQMEHPQTSELYNAYAVRQAESEIVIGVSERAGLRDLRSVRIGSRVFIRPLGMKALASGRTMQQFEVRAERLEPLEPQSRQDRKHSGGSGTPSESGPPPSDNIPF
jgi:hypothetical protein